MVTFSPNISLCSWMLYKMIMLEKYICEYALVYYIIKYIFKPILVQYIHTFINPKTVAMSLAVASRIRDMVKR